MANENYVLTLSCPDQPGIVAALSAALFETGCNILEAHQFNDDETLRFFTRLRFAIVKDGFGIGQVRERFSAVGKAFGMDWIIRDLSEKQRVLLLVSRFDHCLADILYRWRSDELPMEISGIISNYPRDSYAHLDLDDIPFHYLPITKETKVEQEAAIWQVVEDCQPELVVLARYMQILSDDLSRKLYGRCINIHHSFLPGFRGAKPYHQAHIRGVKLIGATAHYVTPDLDEGPIIEQDVERISHQSSAADLVRKGRDIERRVLSRAIAWHLQGRVIPNGSKTVVFPD